METIGLRELNQNPSKVVARVRSGVAILVTDRGEPVLRMVPEMGNQSGFQRAVMRGEVKPPVDTTLPEVIDLGEDFGGVGDLLIAERDRERNR